MPVPVRERSFQVVLIASTLALSWLSMMVVHEFGHFVCGWLSGGTVSRVVLHPFEFSRTEMQLNPHPLIEAWGGALVGAALPLALSACGQLLRWPGWYVLRFFAGSCLIANGLYLAVVSLIPNAADPADIMREGSPQWLLVLFGVVTFPLGLLLWNGLGPHFGLARAQGRVSHVVTAATALLLLVLVALELMTYAG